MAVYEWVKDISKASRQIDSQTAGEEVERIRVKNGGTLSPRQLWESQRDPDSVLHEAFTWDDQVAGEKYRDIESRQIVKNLKVVYVNESQEQASVKAFSSIRTGRTSRVYVETLSAMQDEQTGSEILQEAYNGLVSWRNRWRDLCGAADFFTTLDSAIDQMSEFVDSYGKDSFSEGKLREKVVEVLQGGPLKPVAIASNLNVPLADINSLIDGETIVRGIGGLQLSGVN